VYNFLELLPNTRIRYFLFKTAGDKFLNGGSTNRMRMALAHKSWKLVHESFYTMPANMASKAKPEIIAKLVEAAKQHAVQVVNEILAGKRVLLPDTSTHRAFSLINRAESRGCSKGSRFWRADSNCIQCGKCVRECPTHNIELTEGKIVFSNKCIFCLRCWWQCPTRAINHPYINFVLLKQPYTLPK
jgi:ferredoxin